MPYRRSQRYGGEGAKDYRDNVVDFRDNLTETAFIRSVTVWAGSYVDAIQTTWWLIDGGYLEGLKHGGDGGGKNTFTLEADEYITEIFGRLGPNYQVPGRMAIHQLGFKTNYGDTYGPCGQSGERFAPFSISVTRCGGFFGRCGPFLDAIGALYPVDVT